MGVYFSISLFSVPRTLLYHFLLLCSICYVLNLLILSLSQCLFYKLYTIRFALVVVTFSVSFYTVYAMVTNLLVGVSADALQINDFGLNLL